MVVPILIVSAAMVAYTGFIGLTIWYFSDKYLDPKPIGQKITKSYSDAVSVFVPMILESNVRWIGSGNFTESHLKKPSDLSLTKKTKVGKQIGYWYIWSSPSKEIKISYDYQLHKKYISLSHRYADTSYCDLENLPEIHYDSKFVRRNILNKSSLSKSRVYLNFDEPNPVWTRQLYLLSAFDNPNNKHELISAPVQIDGIMDIIYGF